MNEIKIGDNIVGSNHSVYIIAEIGSNHDGSIETAKKMIEIAANCGVNAVKFQFFKADTIAANINHKIAILENGKTLYQLYKENETPYEWISELNKFCRKKKIEFLASPFDKEAVDLLDNVDIKAYKIASFEIVDYQLIDYISAKKKPIILSTGMANLGDIEAALNVIENYHSNYILLHCGINYPLDFRDVNLRAMETLRNAFDCPIGYSDHTEGIIVPILGVSFGMSLIEKHFTLDKNLTGPDHKFAANPEELKEMVDSIRKAELALGSFVKHRVESEKIHFERGRRSIFAIKDIKKGTLLNYENLGALRPGIGLHPRFLDIIFGKKAARDILKNTPITWDLIL